MSELKHSSGITDAEQKKKKKGNESLGDLWGNIKCTNIHVTGVPEGEERERKGLRTYLKT